MNERGKEPILNVIKAIGHWPMVQGKDWDESKWEWKGAILSLRKYISKKNDDIFSGKEITNEIDTVSASGIISNSFQMKGMNSLYFRAQVTLPPMKKKTLPALKKDSNFLFLPSQRR